MGSVRAKPEANNCRRDLRSRAKVLAADLAAGMIGAAVSFGIAATAASAAAPPTATTGAASMISGTTAVVAGTVEPNDLATTYVFQYGPTALYPSQTAVKPAGSGTSSVAVNTTLAALVSGTTYHYRIVATNALGSFLGADATFTTAKAPPAVVTGQPSTVTSSSAAVKATVNPAGKATTYSFQYGPTAGYGSQTPVMNAGAGNAKVTVSASLEGLLGGTSYHYRVIATNADGAMAGADVAFLTNGHAVDQTASLPVVSEASAIHPTTSGVQLGGVINPAGSGTTSWYFDIGLTTAYGLQTKPQTIVGLGVRSVSVQLSGLQSGATYHYRLVAYNDTRRDIGPDSTLQTAKVSRTRPAAFSMSQSLKRGPRYRSIRVSGHVRLPPALSGDVSCNGKVDIEVRRGGETIALRRASLRRDCTYSTIVHFSSARIRRATRLSVSGVFTGNGLLLPMDTRRTLFVTHG